MPTERIRKVLSRSGHLNVEVEGVPYHGAYDPRREVLKFNGSYSIEKADVILHFGWGLGYCGEVLKNRMKPSARVIVFEPDEELFKFALAHTDNRAFFEDSRFQFVVGDRMCQFFDEGSLDGCRETDEFLWLLWPNACRTHRASAAALQETFNARLRDLAGNLFTHLVGVPWIFGAGTFGRTRISSLTATFLCEKSDRHRECDSLMRRKGILSEGVEILSLRDAIFQCCRERVDVAAS